jgi:hypothetical protein
LSQNVQDKGKILGKGCGNRHPLACLGMLKFNLRCMKGMTLQDHLCILRTWR